MNIWVAMTRIVSAIVMLASLLVGQSTKRQSPPHPLIDKPDLVPLLHHPMNAQIRVKNMGTVSAAASKLTLDCEKLDAPSKMHSCPNLPLTAMAAYFDPEFPNHATIRVPALASGATFIHTLTFWEVSRWPSGEYKFTAVVDAAHELDQENAKNNIATSILIVR